MKKSLFIFSTIGLIFASCGENSADDSDNKSSNESTEEIAAIVAEYKLNTDESSADWERTLDQKPTKQKTKMFGQMVDIELGAVKLTSNGSATLKEGGLSTTDDVLTKATVVFDMASFKIAKEKGNGLFDVKTHPNSTLILTEISDSKATGELTIEDTSKKMDVTISSTKIKDGYTLNGSFVVNTLDFPLRDKVTEKDINKDEIKVTFELVYN